MASTVFVFCGPCENRKAHRQATAWCTVCNEGLCKECQDLHESSKLSKDHTTFDENLYPLMKAFLKDLKTDCSKHKKRFDFFCKNHESLCCVNCVTDDHRHCSKVDPVDEVNNPKEKLTNLVEEMTVVSTKMEQIKTRRTENIKKLNVQKTSIQMEIKDARISMNNHLDTLEKDILEELNDIEQRHSLNIAQMLFEMDTRKQVLLDLKVVTDCVIQLASGIQSVLATKKVEDLFNTEKAIINTVLEETGSNELQLQFDFNEKVKSLPTELKFLGKISTKDPKAKAKPKEIEDKRSSTKSLPPRVITPTDPNRIQLKLVKKIKTSKRKSKNPVDVRGCVILSDGKLLFADWSDNKRLMVFNVDGSHSRDIGVTGKPYDITRLDGERIAVSFPEDYAVQIFDVISDGYPIFQTIKVTDQCWGIFYNDEKLMVGCNGYKVLIMNLSGNVLKIVPSKVSTVYCISSESNFVYYSDEINNTIHCSDFDGNEIWTFHDLSMKYPCSVAYDHDGYVFIVGNISQNLMVMSADGQLSRSVLGKLDGLDGPAGIHYDRQSNRLLIVLASFKGHVALYDVFTKGPPLTL